LLTILRSFASAALIGDSIRNLIVVPLSELIGKAPDVGCSQGENRRGG
jgi:hypothetical protein